MKKPYLSLTASMLAIRRRKLASLLLALVMAISSGVCVVLGGLLTEQETALADTVASSEIRCTVTDAGGRSDNVGVLSMYLDMVVGKRREVGCLLDDYVKDVRCISKESLARPLHAELRRLYTLDSDPAFGETGGASATFNSGWDESVFRSDDRVCLLSRELEYMVQDGRVELENDHGERASFEVVGFVDGVTDKVVYCPFFAEFVDGITAVHPIFSMSFAIADNGRLDEAKKALFEYFTKPSIGSGGDILIAGLLVQDDTYLDTLKELESNLSLLRLLLPILIVMTAFVAFFVGYLTNRRRVREFAVMRCMGQKRVEVFLQVFFEQGVLTVIGCAVGFAIGCAVVPPSAGGLTVGGVSAIFGLVGSVCSAVQICRADPLTLMKAKE